MRKTVTRPVLTAFLLATSCASFAQSTCYGTAAKGKIAGAVQLPPSGKNFSAYNDAGVTLGRTHVPATVPKSSH